MRTKKNIRAILMAASLMAITHSFGQVSVPSNAGGPGDYVGWDATALQPLDIKHKGNYSIDWYTNAIQRITLLPDATYTIGGFTGQNKDGNLLLSPDVNNFLGTGAPGPYSLLHLAAADNTAQQGSYRDWMKTGITPLRAGLAE